MGRAIQAIGLPTNTTSTRAGWAFALGCISRYTGSFHSQRSLPETVSALDHLAMDKAPEAKVLGLGYLNPIPTPF